MPFPCRCGYTLVAIGHPRFGPAYRFVMKHLTTLPLTSEYFPSSQHLLERGSPASATKHWGLCGCLSQSLDQFRSFFFHSLEYYGRLRDEPCANWVALGSTGLHAGSREVIDNLDVGKHDSRLVGSRSRVVKRAVACEQ
jgi:hypothetical protein